MVEMKVLYQGEKHCELTHGPSQTKIETDAPRDNKGRGERFSPTDLVGAALGSCILTTIAILGENEGIKIEGATAQVKKEMTSAPRRIGALHVELNFPAGIPTNRRHWLQTVAETCPVTRSLHPDVRLLLSFNFPD